MDIDREVDFRERIKTNPSIWFTKLFMGKKVYGYHEFLEQNDIQVPEPA